MDGIARKVLQNAREMVPGRFTARPASPQTHPHIAWRDYDAARRTLEALGFRHLGDIEPLDVATDPAMSRRNVLRVLSADDGAVTAAFYRIPLRWTVRGILARLLGGSGGFLEMETLYEDGTVLLTSTATPAGVWTQPSFHQGEFLPRSTSPEALLARHRERMRQHAAARPDVRPVSLRSLDEVIAANDAAERTKRAFRESLDWITRDELARLSRLSGPRLDQLDDAVRRAIAREP